MDAKEAIKLKEQIERLKIYRDMETADQDDFYMFTEVIEAAEKQVPKEPILQPDEELPFEFEHYRCPNCRCIIHQHYKKSRQPRGKFIKFCYQCGQAIKR